MYETTRKSLIRFVTDQIAAINTALGTSLTYTDFDAHGDLAKAPAADVVGLHAFEMADQDQFQVTTFGIMVSAYDDPNLLTQNKYMNWFYNRMRIRNLIPLLDPVSGAVIGNIIMMLGTVTFPVERADTRAASYIMGHGKVVVAEPAG
jgi:hypothetical protein